MGVDDQAPQGARSSTPMVLTLYIFNTTRFQLDHDYDNSAVIYIASVNISISKPWVVDFITGLTQWPLVDMNEILDM